MVPSPQPAVFPTLRTPSGDVPADAPWWNPQRPSTMPHHRYRPAHSRVPLPLEDRTWPSSRIDRAPLWVPVDLRDGNQALAEPMDTERKRRMFDLLITMGYKEIEIGYPSASQTDFDFVRHLAHSGAVPDDVTVSVFTPARHDLIDRTIASIEGLPRALVHLYTPTAPTWRDVVLGRSRAEVRELILDAATHLLRRAERRQGADVRFEFSPEVFNLTEPDFVLELCDGLTELWEASPDRPVVHNLPATVEIATPNVYADQIEYMDRHLARRESVILSVHPHNDRGTGVACAELAVLAGAQRVEGCLFGNGERTGNVDLVTLALNLYAQGVNPMIDFSDVDAVREVVEHCNRLPVHPRHPYGGDLVHTAFSGTHQDAIAKGMAHHAKHAAELGVPVGEAPWAVPYLPIDPGDVGRTYEEVIRINSQFGQGRHRPPAPHPIRTGPAAGDAPGLLAHGAAGHRRHRAGVVPQGAVGAFPRHLHRPGAERPGHPEVLVHRGDRAGRAPVLVHSARRRAGALLRRGREWTAVRPHRRPARRRRRGRHPLLRRACHRHRTGQPCRHLRRVPRERHPLLGVRVGRWLSHRVRQRRHGGREPRQDGWSVTTPVLLHVDDVDFAS